MEIKKQRGGARPGSGRKPKKPSKVPMIVTTVEVEETVAVKCRKKHGSLPNALRAAAKIKRNG